MQKTHVLFSHPFSKDYWKQAVSELKNIKILVFAALMIALRIVFKSIYIPVTADLRINTAFLVNAVGATVYGPVIAVLAAAITDTLGYIIAPAGPYFFPFIFVEMAGSFVFALFFYRTRITPKRVILARFCVNFFVNIVLNTPIMMWYYQLFFARYYAPLDMLRIMKNLALFPLESLLLILLFRFLLPALRRIGYQVSTSEKLQLNKRHLITLTLLAVIGTGCVAGYFVYYFNHTSLSASYSTTERYQQNEAMNQIVLQQHAELSPWDTVTIIESAYGRINNPNIQYQVSVYQLLIDQLDGTTEAIDAQIIALRSLSKSKAATSPLLKKLFTATITAQKDTNQLIAYQEP